MEDLENLRRANAKLRAEIAAARADKVRVDWLQQQQMREAKSQGTWHEGETLLMAWTRDGCCRPIIHTGDFRGAVDAAMKADPIG